MTDKSLFYRTSAPDVLPKDVICLIGHPVAHSLSPQIHNAISFVMKKPLVYVNFDVLPDDLEQAVQGLRALGVKGFNITMPHKESILPYLDNLGDSAREVGSVNTVRREDKQFVGYNTDGEGFLRSVREFVPGGVGGKNILMLGAGGSAKAVAAACLRDGCGHLQIWNRTVSKAEDLCRRMDDKRCAVGNSVGQAELIINTTAAGMGDQKHLLPDGMEHASFGPGQYVCDLIYNPVRTALLQKAGEQGAMVCNGYEMLFWQAVASWEIWNDCRIGEDDITLVRRKIQEGG